MTTGRIPIAAPLETREIAASGSFLTDSMLVNCYVETQQDGRKFVVKRPGLTSAFTYNGGGATNGQGTTYFGGSLYAMGSNVLYRLTGSANGSADGSAWVASTAGPFTGRAYFASAYFNGQFFVMGGSNIGGIIQLNDIWATSDMVNWAQVVPVAPWKPRERAALVVLGNTMYLMGGQGNGTYFNDVWSSTDGVNWSQVIGNALWSARRGHTCFAFNQGIWLMGGNNLAAYYNDVWFSPDGATWSQQTIVAGWSARMDAAALFYNEKMWIVGGIDGAGSVQSVYSSPDGVTWTNTGNLPTARAGMQAAVYSGKMFFLGGNRTGVGEQTQVWSSTDGTTFTVVTAAYGGIGLEGGRLVSFITPSSVSTINAPTLWLVAGFDASVGYRNLIYRATLNTAQPASYSPATAASSFEEWQSTTQNAGQYLIWKNSVDAWVLYAGTLQKIASQNYPTSTVSGIVNLDDTVYVMDASGVIYGSNLSDPFTWSALNFITADYESDTGIAIAKYGQNIVALKSTTMQFFYDAGRYPGSPLLPIVSENRRVGCASAESVVAFNDNLFWVARTKQKGRFVAMLNGTVPTPISTPDVDRILDNWNPGPADRATGIRINGHDFYILKLSNSEITLAFDLKEQRWSILGNTSTLTFSATHYVTDGSTDYLQDVSLGVLYSVSAVVYQDAGRAFTVQSTGVLVDNNTNHRKFCGSVTVIGDRKATSPNNATVSWSDDDGQTYSAGYTVDLTKARPKVPRVGSFRRRRFRISHSSNNPMRVEAFELEMA